MRTYRCSSVQTVLAAALLVATTAAASAHTIHVDQTGGGDYLTIQGGIDAAAYGDTVLVAPGTYYEHLYMGPTADGVTLLSEAGPESTIIDNEGASYYSVIHCENVGPNTRIEGFTITGGYSHYWGGGIRADNADVRIVSCTISGCLALRMEGGGIGSSDSSIEVSGCRIESNRGGDGGGIGVWGGEAIIKENTIIGNEAVSFVSNQTGGGIYVSCDHAEITDNLIEGNSAVFSGGGIQIWGGGSVTILDNRIIGNTASYDGGGIALYLATCLVSGNVIAGNQADMWGGGAVDVRNPGSSPPRASAQFVNNVFFGNTSDGDKSAIRIHQGGPTPIFHNNFFADNTTYEVLVSSTPSADTIDFTGNWWGTDDPDEIALKIRDCNDDPALLWCIDFSDWCTDPSCDGQVTSVEDPPEAAPISWGRIKSLYR